MHTKLIEIAEKLEWQDLNDLVLATYERRNKELIDANHTPVSIPNRSSIIERDRAIVVSGLICEAIDSVSKIVAINGDMMLYNGKYFEKLSTANYERFIGSCLKKLCKTVFEYKNNSFIEAVKKVLSSEFDIIDNIKHDYVKINLNNGTLVIDTENEPYLVPHTYEDYFTYCLPYDYKVGYPTLNFVHYINRVLPEKQLRDVLFEAIGYCLIRTGNTPVKLEKLPLLYGTGANGKSVFFEIVTALFGSENITHVSLSSLASTENNYSLSLLENKLINFSSEITNSVFESSIIKQLISGEPINCRNIYEKPKMIRDYAKMIFNCNELPHFTESNNAIHRRLLIIPFNVVIPEEERDTSLAKKIIDNELPGILNYVIAGLKRILTNKAFSACEVCDVILNEYKQDSDHVGLFLSDNEYVVGKTENNYLPLKTLFSEFQTWLKDNGYPLIFNSKKFIDTLRKKGYTDKRSSQGKSIHITKENHAVRES